MNAVFSVGGDVVHPDIPNNFLRLLAEGEILPECSEELDAFLNHLAFSFKMRFEILGERWRLRCRQSMYCFLSRI